jgi:hypothetical protein
MSENQYAPVTTGAYLMYIGIAGFRDISAHTNGKRRIDNGELSSFAESFHG